MKRDQPVSPADRAEPVPDIEDASLRQAVSALGRGDVRRWLVLLEVADLLLDVLSGFLALYLVAVAHATAAEAALGVAVRLAAGLAGDVLVIRLLERFGSLGILRAGAAAAAVLYPVFLVVPDLGSKLAVLAALSVATAPWYPVIQAELYRSLPGRSGVAVSLEQRGRPARRPRPTRRRLAGPALRPDLGGHQPGHRSRCGADHDAAPVSAHTGLTAGPGIAGPGTPEPRDPDPGTGTPGPGTPGPEPRGPRGRCGPRCCGALCLA